MWSTYFDCYLYTDKNEKEIEDLLNGFLLPIKWAYIHCNKNEYKAYYHIYLDCLNANVNSKFICESFGFEEKDVHVIDKVRNYTEFLFHDPNLSLYFNIYKKLPYTYEEIKNNFR